MLDPTGASGVPDGGVPTTDAVFTIEPASKSDWVAARLAVQSTETPGANAVGEQVTTPAIGSATFTAVRFTLPTLVT